MPAGITFCGPGVNVPHHTVNVKNTQLSQFPVQRWAKKNSQLNRVSVQRGYRKRRSESSKNPKLEPLFFHMMLLAFFSFTTFEKQMVTTAEVKEG